MACFDFSDQKKMYLVEAVFQHDALNMATLDDLINQKNVIYEDDSDVPFTLGVFAADKSPDLIVQHENFQYNWITNTDPSSKPGVHRMCVLMKKEIKVYSSERHIFKECTNCIYYLINTWGSKYFNKICKNVMNQTTDKYNYNQRPHVASMEQNKLKCTCKFEINYPIKRRIQHTSYKNCRWFALYFTSMDEEKLMHWSQTDLNSYGKIKQNYDELTNYFKHDFFPQASCYTLCNTFGVYKILLENENSRKGVTHDCDQTCTCQRKILPEYY